MLKGEGQTLMWTKIDVSNKLSRICEKAWDWTEPLSLLYNRSDSKSRNIHWDYEGRLSRAFFTFAEENEELVEASSLGVRFYDTSHATNHHRMNLRLFCTINTNGVIVIVGCELLVQEKRNDFKWVFKSLKEASHSHVACVVLTDGDQATAYAPRSARPQATHLLYPWHFTRFVSKNSKPILGNRCFELRKSIWDLAMEFDIQSQNSLVGNCEQPSDMYDKALRERAT